MSKNLIVETIEKRKNEFVRIAREIWRNPEISYQEKESSALQKKYMQDAGFRITGLDDIQKYAFIAECGEGKPVIGLLGEFDALPGLSQEDAEVLVRNGFLTTDGILAAEIPYIMEATGLDEAHAQRVYDAAAAAVAGEDGE